MAGLKLDPWQDFVLDNALSRREDGTWSAFEVGLVVSRQNGKGSILEARELGGLFLLDEEMIIHSAHLFDTSLEAFNRIMILIESTPDLDRMVQRVVRSHGEEGIEVFRGGKRRRLRFKTRTKGGGRGLTGDCVIVDEAMYFASQTAAALMPTMSARPNPQMWLTGSAGDKDSLHLGRMRQRGLLGLDQRLCYMEWSIIGCNDFCGEDCEHHDPVRLGKFRTQEEYDEQFERMLRGYQRANPGLGIRISVEHIESERNSMAVEEFSCERLGVGDWPIEGDSWRIIGEDAWRARINMESTANENLAFGIDVTPDRSYSCVTVAGLNDDGEIHVEITGDGIREDHRPGTKWVVPRVVELCKRFGAPLVLDRATQAGALYDEFEKAGIEILTPTTREYAQACGSFAQGIVPSPGNVPNTVHRDQGSMTAAVAGAEKRLLSDLWAWDKRGAAADISPLVAATNAVWGHRKRMTEKESASAPWAAYG